MAVLVVPYGLMRSLLAREVKVGDLLFQDSDLRVIDQIVLVDVGHLRIRTNSHARLPIRAPNESLHLATEVLEVIRPYGDPHDRTDHSRTRNPASHARSGRTSST